MEKVVELIKLKIISFITEFEVIKHILEHLELWKKDSDRSPPQSGNDELTYELIYEDLPAFEESLVVAN
ncbi:MAG: hypothetical protein V1872_14640 [bacterium]